MDNKELFQICLEERKVKQEQLQKELNDLDIQCRKATFEENMYYRLAEKRYKYKEILSNKQDACEDKMKELENSIKERKEELTILEMEIEYIESILA